MNDDKLVRHMIFKGEQGCEDLFRCVENGRMYIRQICDEKYVRWLTTSKWSGGYEADTPFKSGLIIKVVDNTGAEYFEEKIIEETGYYGTVAEKAYPFWSEFITDTCTQKLSKYDARSYYHWKEWLLDYKKPFDYDGYSDNWLFCNAKYEPKKKVEKLNYLGKTLFVNTQKATHTICRQTWTELTIYNPETGITEGLIGYLYGGKEKFGPYSEVINFIHEGKRYSMTKEQIEAAYEYRQQQNRRDDAIRQFRCFVLGDEDLDDEDEWQAVTDAFQNEYGIPYPDAYLYITDFVERFERLQDCNVDENATWENAIREVLKEIKNNRK